MVERPSRRSGRGRETPLVVRKFLGGLLEVWKWSGGPPRGPEVVGRPSLMSGNGREAILEKWKRSGGPPEVRK